LERSEQYYDSLKNEHIRKFNETHGKGEYKFLSKIYRKQLDTYKYKHKCGLIFESTAMSLQHGRSKCVCQHKINIPNTPEGFKIRSAASNKGQAGRYKTYRKKMQVILNEKYGENEYKLLTKKYEGGTKTYTFKHSCGLKFKSTAACLSRGLSKCPCLHIVRSKGLTLEEHNIDLQAKKGNDYTCTKYFSMHDPNNEYIHNICDNAFKSRAAAVLGDLKGCIHCSGKDGSLINRVTKRQFMKELNSVENGRDYRIIGDFEGKSKITEFKHNCGNKFKAKPYDVLMNRIRCYTCYPILSNKEVEVNNKIFTLRGYEPFALERLLKLYSYKDILDSKSKEFPHFKYTINRIRRNYIPDLYVKSNNLVIEVKSLSTMGLENSYFNDKDGIDLFDRNSAKAKAVLRKGYKFRMYLFDSKGVRITLPKYWYTLSKTDVLDYIS